MNRKLLHNFVLNTKARRHKDFISWCLGALVVILFFLPIQSYSQSSDSTIQALEKRIQILEQKILQLEYLISVKNDSSNLVTSKEENSSQVVEEKEKFIQCAAKTTKGTRCTRRAKTGSKYCGLHQFESEPKKKK
ncbi:MAG: hypothetical protein KGZ58_13025 [Ignavibacteriales bacterium]|nr:hypothetical protein [Ignavibacteriales bacterium]